MTDQTFSPDDLPDWWKKLSPEQQASVRRALGKDEDWQPIHDAAAQQYEETRERIREIERRALEKLRPKNSGEAG